MRTILTSVVVAVASTVFADRPLVIGSLPPCEYADTEVTTNCPFSFSNPNARHLTVKIELTATASNNVEIAFGRDVDEDLTVSSEEVAISVGWDSGSWILRQGPATGSRDLARWAASAVTAAPVKSFDFTLNFRGDEPESVEATENGQPVVWDVPDPLPDWTVDRSWNMARISVRGVDAANESVRAKVKVNGTAIMIR